ncbi:MAG: hypothetical protein ACXVJT_12475, partial [Thermoanaerobaculia bacterium]
MNITKNSLRAKSIAIMLLGGVILGGCTAEGGSPFGVFATEDWVRNQLREQNARIEARFGKLDERLSQVAAQTAEARKVADEGVRKASAVDTRLTQDEANRYTRTMVDSKSLQFATGKFNLQPDHKQALDAV